MIWGQCAAGIRCSHIHFLLQPVFMEKCNSYWFYTPILTTYTGRSNYDQRCHSNKCLHGLQQFKIRCSDMISLIINTEIHWLLSITCTCWSTYDLWWRVIARTSSYYRSIYTSFLPDGLCTYGTLSLVTSCPVLCNASLIALCWNNKLSSTCTVVG